jgi:hypothetical protein
MKALRKRKKCAKTIALSALLSVSIGLTGINPANAKGHEFAYLPGDFHQHSLYTDGGRPFFELNRQNPNYGLDWWANSEHGGERNRDGVGKYWDEYTDELGNPANPILGDEEFSGGHQEMWRWQSLRDFVYPDIKILREFYPDKPIISGLEWNVPGHEHCSTAIYQYDDTATAISEFEFRFDRSDDDNSRARDGEIGILGAALAKTNGREYACGDNTCASSKDREDAKQDAILGVEWLQAMKDAGIGDAWVVPAHVERAWSYTIEDFRNWMDAGPDVVLGAEFAPGHQTSSDRGFGRGSLGGGTYGGTGFYAAMVGGLWDGLLAEGRKFFHFASSDYHWHWGDGGSDFWPGEYQKTYTYINTKAEDEIQAVFDGNRSGNTWNVQGDLIDELEFTVRSRGKEAMMGQTLQVKKGQMVMVKIKVHDPKSPNFCPFDFNNPSLAQVGIEQPLNMPELHHIDLIAGTITGNVPMTVFDAEGRPDTDATDYGTDAQVIETFYRVGKGSYMHFFYRFIAEKDMFLRLRGTNLPAGVPFETDVSGNPLADSEANDNIYELMETEEEGYNGLTNKLLNLDLIDDLRISNINKLDDVVEAYADLWFYSNPIFIEVVD